MAYLEEKMKVVLPKLGESILGATVTKWFKSEGDYVYEDQPLLEVSTDKVNSEIPSCCSGYLESILVAEGEYIDVGATLAILSLNKQLESDKKNTWLSPCVKELAKKEGLSEQSLGCMQGSGFNQRVTKKDIREIVESRDKESSVKQVEKVRMSTVRKSIAEQMMKAIQQVPHATLIQEIDVTEICEQIEQKKRDFFETNGAKLTITVFLAKAIAKAALKYPFLNASLEEDYILKKQYVNLGLAVNTEAGVMVPVIKDCHLLTLDQIAKQISGLSQKAKEQNLSVNDVSEGTITLTNFGMGGALIGIPLLRMPEVAILGVGAIKEKLCIMGKGLIASRKMLNVSLTFDHRVVDGMYGCEFLSYLQDLLEKRLLDDTK